MFGLICKPFYCQLHSCYKFLLMFRCGSANAPECPAIKVMCRTCNKKGHFARVCRSAAQTHSVRQVEIPEYTQSESPAKLHCTVDIHAGTLQKTVKLTVDAGASVSVLPKCIVEEYFEGVPLQPPAARLVTPKLQSKCWDACLLQW